MKEGIRKPARRAGIGWAGDLTPLNKKKAAEGRD